MLCHTGATSVDAFLVNRWFHKLFHFSPNDDDSEKASNQRQHHRERTFDTRAVCDVGEGIAGTTAMTGRTMRVRDCSTQQSLCGSDHDRGSLLCWPVLERLYPATAAGAPEDPAAQIEDIGGGEETAMLADGRGAGVADDDTLGQSSSAVLAVLQVYCADGQLAAEAIEVLWNIGRLMVPLLKGALALKGEQLHRREAEALYSLSQIVPREVGLVAMVEEVVSVAERLTGAERVCLFFVDDVANELWVAKSVDFDDATIEVGSGLCGHTAATGEVVNVIDSYEDSRFDSRWDKQTGFVTKRCVCVWVLCHAFGGVSLHVLGLFESAFLVYA